MKKALSYLFAALGLLVFTACGGGVNSEEAVAKELMVCVNTGEPCLEDHSCCVIKKEAEVSDENTHDHEEHEHDHEGHEHDHEGHEHGED